MANGAAAVLLDQALHLAELFALGCFLGLSLQQPSAVAGCGVNNELTSTV